MNLSEEERQEYLTILLKRRAATRKLNETWSRYFELDRGLHYRARVELVAEADRIEAIAIGG